MTDIPEICSFLKKNRESKNFSIEEVANRIGIKPEYVQYIEECQISDLPERTYTIAYIYKYLKILSIDLDNDLVAKVMEFPAENPKYRDITENIFFESPLNNTSVHLDNNSMRYNYVNEESKVEKTSIVSPYIEYIKSRNGKIILGSIALLLVVLIIFLSTNPSSSSADIEAEPVDPNTYIQCSQDCWIKVYNSEKVYIDKILHKGDSYIIPTDDKNIMADFGNIKSLEIKFHNTVYILKASKGKRNVLRNISFIINDLINNQIILEKENTNNDTDINVS